MKKILLNQKGLTLIELLAVIVILAIIAAIAIPSVQGIIQNQRDKAVMSDIINFVETARLAHMDNECENSICTYDALNNSLNFYSSKFSIGTVDFTGGTSREQVVVKVNVNPIILKGRNAPTYIDLIEELTGFTEAELLDALK